GKDRPLVHKGLQISSREPRRALGDDIEINIFAEGLPSRVNLKDASPVFPVRERQKYSAVESSWAEKRRIKHVRTVRRGHNDHLFIWLEPIHLNKDLIERLFALVVSTS